MSFNPRKARAGKGRRFTLIWLVLLFFLAYGSSALAQTTLAPLVLDFESVARSGTGLESLGLYVDHNFLFTDSGGHGIYTFRTNDTQFAGSTMLYNNTAYSDTSISRDDGGTFDFSGVDLAPVRYSVSGIIQFVGFRGRDIVVTESFYFDKDAGVQHFFPTNVFTNLTEVRWLQGYVPHQFDNVRVNQVGPPSAGPRLSIEFSVSIWAAHFEYLRPGKTYTIEKSYNLKDWFSFRTFVSPTLALDWGLPYYGPGESAYYRLKVEPDLVGERSDGTQKIIGK